MELLDEADRSEIESMRHAVYATELGQHPENPASRLRDAIDEFNATLVARRGDTLLGFVTVTPPDRDRFALDKYFDRESFPVERDRGLFEIRLLTVPRTRRGTTVAAFLMWAALRYVESRGGQRVVVMGRTELGSFYDGLGLQRTGQSVRSGRVDYEVRAASVDTIREQVLARFERLVPVLEACLSPGISAGGACHHGGATWREIGERFDRLESRKNVVSADVLDAWFPPAPEAVQALRSDAEWLLRTSPPADGAGLWSTIAEVRGVSARDLVLGAGSSDLIYRLIPQLVSRSSSVLLLDPTYGEYAHLLERVLGVCCDRFPLRESEGFAWNVGRLRRALSRGYDLVIWVHPNNPTGTSPDRDTLLRLIDDAPESTTFWVDEAYADYLAPEAILETSVAMRERLIVCKSLSKGYALSGARAAYAVVPTAFAEGWRQRTPPWCISLPAQIAAVHALRADRSYYRDRRRETNAMRLRMVDQLHTIDDVDVLAHGANFVLCRWASAIETMDSMLGRARAAGVYLRDLRTLSPALADGCFRVAVHPESDRILAELRGRPGDPDAVR